LFSKMADVQALVTCSNFSTLDYNAKISLLTETQYSQEMVNSLRGNSHFISARNQQFNEADITKTFHMLIDCAGLLQLALTAAGNQPCSVHILEALSRYQSLISDSTVTCGVFINNSMRALELHKNATKTLKITSNPAMVNRAFGMLKQTTDLACEMANNAKILSEKTDILRHIAETALVEAQRDSTRNEAEKAKIENDLNDLRASQASLNSLVASLEQDSEEVQSQLSKKLKDAESLRNKEFALKLLGTVTQTVATIATGPLGALMTMGQRQQSEAKESGNNASGPETSASEEVTARVEKEKLKCDIESMAQRLEVLKKSPETPDLKAQIDDLESKKAEKEKEYRQLPVENKLARLYGERADTLEGQIDKLESVKYEIKKNLREQKAGLAKNLEIMGTMKQTMTTVQQAIFNLSFCVRALGIVKTAFDQAYVFWSTLQKQCSAISNMSADFEFANASLVEVGLEPNEMNEFKAMAIDSIFNSALSWLITCSVCLEASQAVVSASNKTNEIMCSLPTEQASSEKLNGLINQLKENLSADGAALLGTARVLKAAPL